MAPIHGDGSEGAIQDRYIIFFQPKHGLAQHFEAIGQDLSSTHDFMRLDWLPGYAANMDRETLDDRVRQDPGVRMVEVSQSVSLIHPVDSSDSFDYNHTLPVGGTGKRDYTQDTTYNVPYGLQMVGAAGKLSTPPKDGGTYDYVNGAGGGVQVYVLDTGIRITHTLFQGRAKNFMGLAPTDTSPYVNEPMDDSAGHGTHVAGTIGASVAGVAPLTNLWNVKVLGANGGSSDKIAQAITDVMNDHNDRKSNAENTGFRGSIINMSLGWTRWSDAANIAIMNAWNAGIVIFVAAGNENLDSTGSRYPCTYAYTECVAAVDNTYTKADFSNYGRVVSWLAPGVDTLSLSIKNDNALRRLSGTSMATPHVSGLAAIFTSWLGLANSKAANIVWWNSLTGITSGFASTSDFFVTSGIHSPQKYPNEPFRWAGDWPVDEIQTLGVPTEIPVDTSTPSNLPLSALVTTAYTNMSFTTLPSVTGLSTDQTDNSIWDPTIPGPTGSDTVLETSTPSCNVTSFSYAPITT